MRRLAGLVLLVVLSSLTTACSRTSHTVACNVTYGGVARRLLFGATIAPYAVRAVDVAGRFRFKAIYVREPWSAASVNVYVYAREAAADTLLLESKFGPPFAPQARFGFTGRQLVYSPDQRELEYWCELQP